MLSLKRGRFIALGAALGLAAAAAEVSTLIGARQAELEAASSCVACTATDELVLAFERLEQRIAAVALSGVGEPRADVDLRMDAVRGRLEDLTGAGAAARDPEAAATLGDLAAALDALAPLPAEADRPEQARAALRRLAPLDFALARLSAEARRLGAERAARARGELARLYRVFTAVLVGLFGFGAAALLLVRRRNRRLAAATERLAAASADLAAAHAAASALNGELTARNAVLDRRDRELSIQNGRFDAALDNMPLALCMVDAGERLVIYNGRFAALFGLDVAPIPGLLFADLVGMARGTRLADVHARQRALAAGRDSAEAFAIDLPAEGGASPAVVLSVSHRAMRDGGWVATYEDVTRRLEIEARVDHLSRHDPLTDLSNRAFFAEQIDAALADAARRGGVVSVHCVDIDRLRDVNEGFGADAGDALLREAARRLLFEAGGSAVARLGGSAFAILLSGGEPDAFAERIARALGTPFRLGGAVVEASASVGHARAPEHAEDAAGLLGAAELALAAAKRGGRGGVRGFAPDLDAARRARRSLEADLAGALAAGELELHFQPLVDARRLAVTGFEALLRWRHPVRGLVPPSDFVPVAEETGMIGAIGAWALDAACREAASWSGRHTVAVNLSPAQFGATDLVALVDGALARSGLDPHRLELEITESVPLGDDSLAALHAFRSRGIRIAMDDFGTGYASLSYLRRFPFDKIKIDQSFVRDVESRPDCMEIVRSIAALAQGLGITTTAEGVETAEQFARLRSAGCDQVQGFHFGRPRPSGQVLFAIPAEAGAAA